MLRNVMLTLAYDGADFHGWQRQPGLRTVQDCLEQAVRRIVRHQVIVIGCSRTDAGVHAAGYAANFFTTSPVSDVALHRSIGSRIPKDMTLIHVETAPLTFHATRSAITKLYRYRIHNARGRPCELLAQRFTYHVWQLLDLDAMREAAGQWLGTHDFTSFAAAGNVRESNVRTIQRIEIYRDGEEVRFDIEGSGFLYKQVRNMVGTLVEIGRGQWPSQRAAEILSARDRAASGPTAPARGLCLQWVRYDLPGLPAPGPTLLETAARYQPPTGMDAAEVSDAARSDAPRLSESDDEESPPA